MDKNIAENKHSYFSFLEKELSIIIKYERNAPAAFLENIHAHKELSGEFFLDRVKKFIIDYKNLNACNKILPYDAFYLSVLFLAYLREEKSFEAIISLCSFQSEKIDDLFGELFITEGLSITLALTGYDKFNLLKPIIENKEIDIFIRDACLNAGAFMWSLQKESTADSFRTEYVLYLNKLLRDCINRPNSDADWCSNIIGACIMIGASENLELIKDAFSFQISNPRIIGIDDVLKEINNSQAHCKKTIEDDIDKFINCYIKEVPLEVPLMDNEKELAEESFFKLLEKKLKAVDNFLSDNKPQKIGRNDLCACNSQKKYKKCCLTRNTAAATSAPSTPPSISIEEHTITYEPIDDESFVILPDQDKKTLYAAVSSMDSSNAHKFIPLLEDIIQRYPEAKIVYSNLYKATMLRGNYYAGIDIVKKMIQKFPNYLFGLTAYADYYLKRGEPEKVPLLFKNCWTLKQLYPDRTIFHVSESLAFHYTIARYLITQGKLDDAKMHYSIIKKLDPENFFVKDVYNMMKRKLMNSDLNLYKEEQSKNYTQRENAKFIA